MEAHKAQIPAQKALIEWIQNNQREALDPWIQQHPEALELTTLPLDNIHLDHENALPALISVLPHLKQLKIFSLHNNKITQPELAQLIAVLPPTLESLVVTNNTINSVQPILDNLDKLTSLKRLILDGKIPQGEIINVINVLKTEDSTLRKSLKLLKLSGAEVDADTGSALNILMGQINAERTLHIEGIQVKK
jgi:Leucine-rich repeat (LRR) protein